MTEEARSTKKPPIGDEVTVRGPHEVGALPVLVHLGILSMETPENAVKHDDTHVERVLNEKAVTEVVTGVLTVGACLPVVTKTAGANAVVDLSPIPIHPGTNGGPVPALVDDLGTYLL